MQEKLENNIIAPKVPGECILDFPQDSNLESRVIEMQKDTFIWLNLKKFENDYSRINASFSKRTHVWTPSAKILILEACP